MHVAWALGKIGDGAKEAIPALRAIVEEKPVRAKVFFRLAAAEALVKLDPPRTEEWICVLRAAVRDPDLAVRRDAVEALGRLGPVSKDALPDLDKVLCEREQALDTMATDPRTTIDPHEALAEAVAKTLGRIGEPAKIALPVLREALNDDSSEVRAAAIDAIRMIERRR